jgi:HK97 family phage major capsid protein
MRDFGYRGQHAPTHPVLERKDGDQPSDTAEIKKAVDGLVKGFQDFKDKNDQELDQLRKSASKGTGPSSDPVTQDEVKKLSDAMDLQQKTIDDLRADLKRAPQGGDGEKGLNADQLAHKKAWNDFVRKGIDSGNLHELAAKALSVNVDPQGGYLAPAEVDRAIDRLVSQVSPMRQLAQVIQISSGTYKKPFNVTGTNSGWVAETSSRPQTNNPVLQELEYPVMELFAQPAATQTLLDDAYVNIEDWLASEVQIEFAEQEGKAFINGDGVGKPRGMFNQPTVADANWAFGRVGYVVTGVSGGFAATNPSDNLIDLLYAPKVAYRQNGRFLMNRRTASVVRKFKDTQGQYLWQPALVAGQPESLLGYPVEIAEDVDNIAANSFSVAFGDFKRGYLIVDRIGTRVLRDPFSAKPYVLFYTTKRVGGGVQNYEAYKLLKFGTS